MTPVFQALDFLRAFLALLPRGRVWPRDADAVQNQTLLGLNTIYESNSARGVQLLTDAFPASTFELLPEWEATLGLPDPCAGSSPSTQARVSQVVARLTGTGGQSIPYFKGLAASLGYDITITQFSPSRFGGAFGMPFGDADWAHAWQINAPQFTVNYASFGGAFGAAFAAWNNTVLQCETQALAPAHTILNFSYTE